MDSHRGAVHLMLPITVWLCVSNWSSWGGWLLIFIHLNRRIMHLFLIRYIFWWKAGGHRVAAALLIHKHHIQIRIRQIQFQFLVCVVRSHFAEAFLLGEDAFHQMLVFIKIIILKFAEALQMAWWYDGWAGGGEDFAVLVDTWEILLVIFVAVTVLGLDWGMGIVLHQYLIICIINIHLFHWLAVIININISKLPQRTRRHNSRTFIFELESQLFLFRICLYLPVVDGGVELCFFQWIFWKRKWN